MKYLLSLCAVLLLLSFSSCQLLDAGGTSGSSNSGGGKDQSLDDLNVTSSIGRVQQISMPAGPTFWGILSDAGKRYEVLNLAEEFRQHDLPVRFAGTIRFVGTPSSGYGPTLFVTKIEKI